MAHKRQTAGDAVGCNRRRADAQRRATDSARRPGSWNPTRDRHAREAVVARNCAAQIRKHVDLSRGAFRSNRGVCDRTLEARRTRWCRRLLRLLHPPVRPRNAPSTLVRRRQRSIPHRASAQAGTSSGRGQQRASTQRKPFVKHIPPSSSISIISATQLSSARTKALSGGNCDPAIIGTPSTDRRLSGPTSASCRASAWILPARYMGNTGYFIPTSDAYLLGILSSWATWFFISKTSQPLRLRGDRWQCRLFTQSMEHIPISDAADAEREAIAELARKCSAAGQGRYAVEKLVRRRLRQAFGESSALPFNQMAEAWWERGLMPLGEALKQSFKLSANPLKSPRVADEWESYLAEKRADHARFTRLPADTEKELNDRVYRLLRFHLRGNRPAAKGDRALSPDDPIRLWLAHRTWLQTAVQRVLSVDPLVPSSVGRVERQETRARSPGFLPWGSAVSDLFNQPRGDVLNKGVVVHFSDSKSSTLSRMSSKESASSTNAPISFASSML